MRTDTVPSASLSRRAHFGSQVSRAATGWRSEFYTRMHDGDAHRLFIDPKTLSHLRERQAGLVGARGFSRLFCRKWLAPHDYVVVTQDA
jgi:hypothetical protein